MTIVYSAGVTLQQNASHSRCGFYAVSLPPVYGEYDGSCMCAGHQLLWKHTSKAMTEATLMGSVPEFPCG